MLRTCTGCKRAFPATLEHFYKTRTKLGLATWCKTCHKNHVRAWVPKDPVAYQLRRNKQQLARRVLKLGPARERREDELLAKTVTHTKRCLGCKQLLLKEAFGVDPKTVDGRKGRCAACAVVYNRQYVAKNWARVLLHAAKGNAKDCSVPFALTEGDVAALFEQQAGCCYWFGLALVSSAERRGLRRPSLDRLTAALGYVPGNVVLACWGANACRGEATPEVFRAFVDQLGLSLNRL
jgi:hypothetical protein